MAIYSLIAGGVTQSVFSISIVSEIMGGEQGLLRFEGGTCEPHFRCVGTFIDKRLAMLAFIVSIT